MKITARLFVSIPFVPEIQVVLLVSFGWIKPLLQLLVFSFGDGCSV